MANISTMTPPRLRPSAPGAFSTPSTIRSDTSNARTPATPTKGATRNDSTLSAETIRSSVVGCASPATPTPNRARAGTSGLGSCTLSPHRRVKSVIDLTRSTPYPIPSPITVNGQMVTGGNLTAQMAQAFATTGRAQPRSGWFRPATPAAAARGGSATPTPVSVNIAAAGADGVRVKTEEGVVVKAESTTPSLSDGAIGPPTTTPTRPGTPIVSRTTPAPFVRASRTIPRSTPSPSAPRITHTQIHSTPAPPARATSMAPRLPTPAPRSATPATIPRTRLPSRPPAIAPTMTRNLPLSARTPTPAPRFNFLSNRGRAQGVMPYDAAYRRHTMRQDVGLGVGGGSRIVTRDVEADVVMVDAFTPAPTGSTSIASSPGSAQDPGRAASKAVATASASTASSALNTRTNVSRVPSPSSTIGSSDEEEEEIVVMATQSAPIQPQNKSKKKQKKPKKQAEPLTPTATPFLIGTSPVQQGVVKTTISIQLRSPTFSYKHSFELDSFMHATQEKVADLVGKFEGGLRKVLPPPPRPAPRQV
ncbi:uncharacterized protein UHOD_01129 [Ustilago sp. UG-2017b]|nr:uncharacterized protein UHOD_01129 [Ustilago sp. UG-2017b]